MQNSYYENENVSQNIETLVDVSDSMIKTGLTDKSQFAEFSSKDALTGLNETNNLYVQTNNSSNKKNLGNFFNNFEDEREIPNVNFGKYTGILHGNTTSNDDTLLSIGNISIDNKKYQVLRNSEFNFSDGTISESDYNNLVYRVASDMGLSDDEKFYSYDDALGIASTYFNRLESGNFTSLNNMYGNTLTGILYEENKLVPNNVLLDKNKVEIAKCVVDDLMQGVRNVNNNIFYYVSNGTYNGFSQDIGGTTN